MRTPERGTRRERVGVIVACTAWALVVLSLVAAVAVLVGIGPTQGWVR